MKTLLWFSIALLLGSYICLQVADPDLWWHITVGRWILGHGEVPRVDHWNMFGVNRPWRAYSWSNEVILAYVDTHWGATGLLVLQLLLGTALSLALQYMASKISRDWAVGAVLGGYATIACFNNYTLRPQAFVWILYGLVLVVANEIAESGTSRKRLAVMVLLGCLWANSHLTAALGLVGAFLWAAQKDDHEIRMRAAAAAACAFFVGTLITPYLGGEWLTFFSKGGHPLKFHVISEFQPATILQYSTGFLVLLVVLQVVVSFTSRRVPPVSRCLLAGGMALAGLTAVKFLPFGSITLSALFAAWWASAREGGATDTADHLSEGIRLARDRFFALSPQTHGAIAFFFISVAAANSSALVREPLNKRIVPVAALDFIQEKKLNGPILNEFGAGGYVMYRFSDRNGIPELLVPIDGRTNVNAPEIWEMYQISMQGGLGWRRYIKAVEPRTILWRQGSAFVSLLFASKEWCRVWSGGTGDNDFMVFIRKEDLLSRASEFTSANCHDGEASRQPSN